MQGVQAMRARWVFAVVAGLVVLGAAFLLGGGVYRTVNAGNGEVYVVNRFTGSARVLSPNEGLSTELTSLPPDVLNALGVDAELWDGEQWLKMDVYNGSTWEVSDLVVVLDVAFEDGTDMHRRLAVPCHVEPLTSSYTGCNVGFSWSERPLKEWSWQIESGRGIPQ